MPPRKQVKSEVEDGINTASDMLRSAPLSRRDAVAVEILRAYIIHHGRVQPDIIRDSVVGPADELARLLKWND